MFLEIKKQNRNKNIFFAISRFFLLALLFIPFSCSHSKSFFPTFLHNLRPLTNIANLKVQTSIFFQGTSVLQRYAFL